jgi:hypothetical protein
MKKLLIPVMVSLPVTIILVIIAGATTEFSFWESFTSLLFFPYAMMARLSYKLGEPIPAAINYAAMLQMPLYGIIIGVAWMKRRLKLVLGALLLLHGVAAGAAVKLHYDNRGQVGVCCSENRK